MLQQCNKEQDDLKNLKAEFQQFKSIKKLEDARELVYKIYPKFKDNRSFVNLGVRYSIYDDKNFLRLLGWFPDEIICYDFA